jgi:hypothetical protein
MAQWAVVLSPERFEAERLYHHETLELTGAGSQAVPGDQVLVLAERPDPVVVALGRVVGDGQPLTVAYTRRSFDAPLPAAGLEFVGGFGPVEPAAFQAVVDRLPAARDARTWLVSVDLPIEADSPAEAVRLFWSYVRELGPRELPAFVSPSGDELAMQAFVLGEEANLDPEEDDED